MFRPVIGKVPDFEQRCTVCKQKDAPYRLSHEYIKDLRGSPQMDCIHLKCLEQRQIALSSFPFQRITVDLSAEGFTEPYASDNELVFEDLPVSRHWCKDEASEGMAFIWDDKQYFIEPKRSRWIKEFTNYPRNIMVVLDAEKWWLYLPKNQALAFKQQFGGVIQDAYAYATA